MPPRHTSSSQPHEWAERGLQYTDLLAGHERLQLLVNRSTRSDAVTEFGDIRQAASDYAAGVGALAQGVSEFSIWRMWNLARLI